ncbi:Pheromone shutdown, TraB [Cynara cardunculus var. scolymus]|uniref:Pheromone shutdown, TraB n=1 Tax=Cynara cardunculus var. scolymus TaxID=59895 RepID=A0A118K2D0_CYNCS|nr:Pheromone shutdown, TraB [Cynara cardunculus var. scolymus]
MNGLTQSRALVNSVELQPLKLRRYNKRSSSSPVGLLFRKNSGGASTKTRTFAPEPTLRQFSVPPKLHRRSTTTLRHRCLTAMDSDSLPHAPELEATTTINTPDNQASSSSLDDQSVVANEESRDANDNEVEGEQKKVLPEELSRSVLALSCESSAEGGNCDVYLVGTAHVSMESCQEVEAVISFLKPQVVFLELCSNRVAVLTPQNLKITLRRTWSRMPLWHKTKLMYSLMFQSIFLPSSTRLNEMLKELDNVDMLTLVIQEMSKEYPTLMETLVHERDQYMSSSLLKVAREHSSVVAVVGKGHLQGIKKYWEQPVEVKELLELPSTKPSVSVSKVLSTVGVAVAGVAIVSGIYLSTRK